MICECTRLFQNDNLWQQALNERPFLARHFSLERLITSRNIEHSMVGCHFGTMLLTKVPNIDAKDFLSNNESNLILQFTIVKAVLDA